MIVCIDARTAFARFPRGMGNCLIDLYPEIAIARPQWHFVMFHRGRQQRDPFGGCPNISDQKIEITGDRFGLWSNLRLPIALQSSHANLFHAPANIGPCFPRVPMVATIHDLIPLEPHLATRDSFKWGEAVRRTAKKSRKILTPSTYSKQQIVTFCGIPDEKVVVNPWAPDRKYQQITDQASISKVRTRYGLTADRRYVFGFGAEDPRKNTEGLLRSWALLPKAVRLENQLLIIGIQEAARPRFQRLADELELGDSCRLHGFAAEEDLAPLLSGASALAFPSLSEGFGLPVLDAFACGTAVLISNVTSLPEVAGDAALLVDPHRVESISDGIRQLLTDETMRRELIARGTKRVKQYTWEACARRVIAVFEEAAG